MSRHDQANERFARTSFLYGANARYLEALEAAQVADPASLDPGWRELFVALGDSLDGRSNGRLGMRRASWERPDWPVVADGGLSAAAGDVRSSVQDALALGTRDGRLERPPATASTAPDADVHQATRDSVHAMMMIHAYRTRGHLHASLDPLGIASELEDYDELSPREYGFEEPDYDRPIFLDGALGLQTGSVRQMLAILTRTYCSTLGVEYMHISDPEQKAWIQDRIEVAAEGPTLTSDDKRETLRLLVEAEGFERFLDVKYKGTKRFGLDGGESLIPALEQVIQRASQLGVGEIVLGMAHRGRLNVLSQVMAKPHRAIFHEFKGGSYTPEDVGGSGDVKYHLGASSDRVFDGRPVHLSLTANPSHLEVVDPVVMGKARAKQDQLRRRTARDAEVSLDERARVLPLLIHGDAAFAGQGVVAEVLGLSGLTGHRVAGTLHVIINNQIGFTTDPRLSRSSPYPSDVAKMIEAPIFHVNGDDPEAVVYAARVATEFRMRFHKPVVIDMFCYRRFGHNEGDEPAFTQPIMYRAIRAHPTTLEVYSERLVADGLMTQAQIDAMKADWRAQLDSEWDAGQSYRPDKADWLDGAWTGLRPGDDRDEPRRGVTAVPADTLRDIGRRLTEVPEGLEVHHTIGRFLDHRRTAIETGEGIDWATAEALAFGSILLEGNAVRLSGQDSERGTFSQRHSVLYDQRDETRYTPLNSLSPTQAPFEVVNSMLSEVAVLGFEYGYSLADPSALTLWEAQFGDFANGAQVVFDQFVSSGERKWLRMSGLVCLLPHGYEGQGPEHSSARLERFLQLCAEDNMQVANCTTPANYFHILRRQLKRDVRKPLILMTPKSLLRHKHAVSRIAELSEGSSFHRLLGDDAQTSVDGPIRLVDDASIRRVVLCSGKVYYDLFEERERRGIDDIYLLRVEQLYPFPAKALTTELSRFRDAEVVWCQEEPQNMGAWSFVEPFLERLLPRVGPGHQPLRYTGRPAAASPATGLMSRHLTQLAALLDDALGG